MASVPPERVATCPRCEAPRIDARDCPRCGVIYARAEERARARVAVHGPEVAEAFRVLAPPTPDRDPAEEAARWEVRLRLWVLPLSLVLAFLFVGTGMGGFVARLVSGMWLHEFGHATAAWLCGYPAVPLPWFTSISPERSLAPTVLLAGGFGYMAWRRWTTGLPWRALPFAAVAVAAVAGRVVSVDAAQVFITFWGDGGALVYAAVLMACFYVEPGSWLHRGALRWGFVGLGALGFSDVFSTWWRAWGDPAEIPFGRIEGVGLSDASKLVDVHGWSEAGLVRAHLVLGVLCLVALAVRYAWGLGTLYSPNCVHRGADRSSMR